MEATYSMRQEIMPPTLLKCRIEDPKPIGDISGNVPDDILESISADVLRHISVSFMDPKVQKDFLEWKMRKNRAIKKKDKKLEKNQAIFSIEYFCLLTNTLYEALLYLKDKRLLQPFFIFTEPLGRFGEDKS